MKMLFSHMDEINLSRGKVHSMMLQSTSNLYRVRKLIYDWVQNNSMTNPYLYIREQDKDVLAKQKYVIHIKQSVFELHDDKDFAKWLVQHLKYQLEHDELFIKHYTSFTQSLEKMVYNTSLYIGDAQIEFELTDKLIEVLLKQLSYQISINEQTHLQSLQLRKIYLELLLKLNVYQKEVIIIYEYPENDVSPADYEELMLFLKGMKATVLCISSNKGFVKYTDIENAFLMYDNGDKYDILQLKRDITIFNYQHPKVSLDALAITLAATDFYGEHDLLDEKYVNFLESSKPPM